MCLRKISVNEKKEWKKEKMLKKQETEILLVSMKFCQSDNSVTCSSMFKKSQLRKEMAQFKKNEK